MLSDKTVQAVCDTLRRFQSKIKVIELYHNQEFKALLGSQSGKASPASIGFHQRMHSPSKSFANASAQWTFPKPYYLIALLKSVTRTATLKVICDSECPTFVTETHYQALIAALGRAKPDD